MKICATLADLSAFRHDLAGRSLALVPTMGALHEGHLSLVRQAQDDGYSVLVTLFVNPTQFAAHEDLATYPDTFAADVAALEALAIEGLFVPAAALMYPPGESTRVSLSGPAQGFESLDRPHFFEGVATVVTKLLIAAQADAAYFGEKDYQQLQVIHRLAADLLIDTHIIGCPTVRAANGLALSSRNAYLDSAQRIQASQIYAQLILARDAILAGAPIKSTLNTAEAALLAKGFERIAYLAYVHAQSLSIAETALPPGAGRLLFAGQLAGVRLIDNLAV